VNATGVLIAMIIAPCESEVYSAVLTNKTVVHACAGTVQYVYAPELPRDPVWYAQRQHLVEGPRTDRAPAAVAEVKPKAKPPEKKKRKKRKARKQ
jgi:hypothetical protein